MPYILPIAFVVFNFIGVIILYKVLNIKMIRRKNKLYAKIDKCRDEGTLDNKSAITLKERVSNAKTKYDIEIVAFTIHAVSSFKECDD